MTIHYESGKTATAIVLLREERRIRVAMQLREDVAEFHYINGMWLADNGESVEFEFEWQRKQREKPAEGDCVCSKELAAKLIDLLFAGGEGKKYGPSRISMPVELSQPQTWPIRGLSSCMATTLS